MGILHLATFQLPNHPYDYELVSEEVIEALELLDQQIHVMNRGSFVIVKPLRIPRETLESTDYSQFEIADSPEEAFSMFR